MHSHTAGFVFTGLPGEVHIRRVYGSVLIGVAVVIGGIFMGVAGLLLLPIIGVFAAIALAFWFGERKAKHKPPIE